MFSTEFNLLIFKVKSLTEYNVFLDDYTVLLEDEAEEKGLDMAEVSEMLMSKKSYMKKWRGLTDTEVDEELKQMAIERQILEDSSFNQGGTNDDSLPYPQDNQVNPQLNA